tara:strand:- start:101 stop:364 length:264 start_codon:yes stop_codon:yes gene_type:complete
MVFGIAKRGFGMLKKSKKPKISEQLKVFKQASDKIKMDNETKKILKDVRSASERAKKFSKDFMKQSYSKSKVNKYLTEEYKKQQRKP